MTELLDYQYKNRFLWVPFLLAGGAALYFSLGIEPNFHFPIIISVLLGAIFFKYKNTLIQAIVLFFFGFFYAMSYTQIIATPQIKDSFGTIPISGVVKDITYESDKTKILIKIPASQIDSDIKSKHINIRATINGEIPNIDDTIKGNMRLFHISGKYAPGAFDFARWAYFAKISGIGFFNDYEIIKSDKNNFNLRTYIHNISNSKLTDALVLGYKKAIPKQDMKIWQSVGVGHIWSISGFHMTLIGGWIFAIFYFLFRAIPRLSKRLPVKYHAILCAWIGLLFYLCVSGISVATIRAFLMTTLIFIATLLGRSVFSLRNASLAFITLFLINPFFVMSAGFQLSFAAIYGLLWFFNNKEYIHRDLKNKVFYWLQTSLLSTIIATIFTLPFIVAHFGYIPLYSVIGNLIILPIFSFVVMPCLILGTILAIFGNHFLINFSDSVYDFTFNIAQHIANMPYANLDMPFVSNKVLMLFIFGFLCIILIVKPNTKNFFTRNINYSLGALFFTFAIIAYLATPKPIFYATPDHALTGFVVDNKILFNKARNSTNYFAFNSWRELNNEEIPEKTQKYKCKKGYCVYETDKWKLVYLQHFTAILGAIENVCKDESVDFIVATFDIKAPNCHAKILKDGVLIYKNASITKVINRRHWNSQP